MSFISDHIHRVDSQLDRLQLLQSASDDTHAASDAKVAGYIDGSNRVLNLQSAIKGLSTASSSRAVLPPTTILALLHQSKLLSQHAADQVQSNSNDSDNATSETSARSSEQEHELEWVLVSKATTQTYGFILRLLLEQTLPLSNEIGYWDEVLGSPKYTALYTVQTAPSRVRQWTSEIYHDAREKLRSVSSNGQSQDLDAITVSDRWRQFYGLVKDTIREHSLNNMQPKLMSPLTRCQLEAQSKRRHLKKLREMSASGLGVLMDEGMTIDVGDEGSTSSRSRSDDEKDEWKTVTSKSVSLMEAVIRNITILGMRPGEFEETVFMNLDDDPETAQQDAVLGSSQPMQIAIRIQRLLESHVPAHVEASNALVVENGRPSRLTRYWLPAALLTLCSSTLLRIFINRKAEIVTWLQDLGVTIIDFWANWVVEPTKKVIATIRHDKDSEIAIMSKESLQGDRASLERMVVDFAIDNPNSSSAAPLTDAQIADVRAKVKEGDLTPVLRAYEKDLRKPFLGTIRGDLIRALLIQVQKTKVDVEVAVGGIDNLLKSQELVFGFVGLTPGILICLGAFRWMGGFFAGRRNSNEGRKHGTMIRILRNIDRILSVSTQANNGMLSYKEHGLLLCEVQMLRQRAQKILPGDINNEFLQELHDLVDLRTGIERQIRVAERIRWAYSRWLR